MASSFDVQIVGGDKLSEFGRRMRQAPKKAQAATRRKLNTAIRPLQAAIRAEVEPAMPNGYEATLSRSLQFRVSIKTGYWASISLTTSAKGKSHGRQIGQMDKGFLRHPVHGRYRRTKRGRKPNPWVAQSIRPGFWSRPVRGGKPRIQREVSKVIVDSLRDSVKG